MEVNNHGQIIYPQNIRKYTRWIYEVRSRARGNNNKITSFSVCIKTANFKYYKCFPSKVEAKAELMRQNIGNKLEIKNTMQDCGNYYKVRLSNGTEFHIQIRLIYILLNLAFGVQVIIMQVANKIKGILDFTILF